MKVSEMIRLLQTHPQDMQIVISQHSEYLLLTGDSLVEIDLCEWRNDGWVHDAREDKPKIKYLLIG